MRKLITVILILSLLLPAAALADTEQELIGAWAAYAEFNHGVMYYYLLRLYEDHTALYQMDRMEFYEPWPDPYCHTATWKLKEDGVHLYYKNMNDPKKEEDMLLELTQAHCLAYRMPTHYVMFVKMFEPKGIGTFHTVTSWD